MDVYADFDPIYVLYTVDPHKQTPELAAYKAATRDLTEAYFARNSLHFDINVAQKVVDKLSETRPLDCIAYERLLERYGDQVFQTVLSSVSKRGADDFLAQATYAELNVKEKEDNMNESLDALVAALERQPNYSVSPSYMSHSPCRPLIVGFQMDGVEAVWMSFHIATLPPVSRSLPLHD
jgi:hypothetical protein